MLQISFTNKQKIDIVLKFSDLLEFFVHHCKNGMLNHYQIKPGQILTSFSTQKQEDTERSYKKTRGFEKNQRDTFYSTNNIKELITSGVMEAMSSLTQFQQNNAYYAQNPEFSFPAHISTTQNQANEVSPTISTDMNSVTSENDTKTLSAYLSTIQSQQQQLEQLGKQMELMTKTISSMATAALNKFKKKTAGHTVPTNKVGHIKYCSSHGICNHDGSQCKNKKEGHQDTAIFWNKMGGNTKGCPKHA